MRLFSTITSWDGSLDVVECLDFCCSWFIVRKLIQYVVKKYERDSVIFCFCSFSLRESMGSKSVFRRLEMLLLIPSEQDNAKTLAQLLLSLLVPGLESHLYASRR